MEVRDRTGRGTILIVLIRMERVLQNTWHCGIYFYMRHLVMSKTFFTSDLHFLHKNIVQYTERGVKTSQEEHDSWLVKLWNSQVSKSDRVWHLGDFCMSRKPEDWLKILGKLNGQKFFIKGNHCSSDVLKKLSRDSHWQFHDYKEIKLGDQHICLMHFPIAHWHRQRYGVWMLHGHLHGNQCAVNGKILDVGLDSAYNIFGEHRFFEFSEIQELMSNKSELDHHSTERSVLSDSFNRGAETLEEATTSAREMAKNLQEEGKLLKATTDRSCARSCNTCTRAENKSE